MIVKNQWTVFYLKNKKLATAETLLGTEGFGERYFFNDYIVKNKNQKFDYYFFLDGCSELGIYNLMQELIERPDLLNIPNLDKNKNVLFINDAEGFCNTEIYESIHLIIKIFGFAGGAIEYQNCSINNQQMYNNWCSENKVDKLITTCSYNNHGFIENKHIHFYDDPKSDIVPIDFNDKKLFNSFNWSPWSYRLGLIGLLNMNNLLDSGFVSSPSDYTDNREKDIETLIHGITSFFSDHHSIRDNILSRLDSLIDSYPLKLDSRSEYNDRNYALVSDNIHEYRANSLIEVITESKITGEHFFSEKTYMAIKSARPFIMMCSVDSLKSLRSLGFKTFHPIIDESYDDEPDNALRLVKVVNELLKLKELRKADNKLFNEKYNELLKVAEYNKNLFLEMRSR